MRGLADQREIIEALRDRIRRIERRPARRTGAVVSGLPDVDMLLPAGFPRGALSELAGGPASGKTVLALSVIRSVMANGGLAAFLDGRRELYPPAAQTLGLDLERLLVVRPSGPSLADDTLLWAAEVLLASGAFEVVAIDAPARVPGARGEAMLRRLRAAAEKCGAVGLWLEGGDSACRVPAAVRLELRAALGGRLCVRVTGGGAAPRRGVVHVA